MSRRGAGAVLLFISALLYSMRILAAAVFGSGVQSWNSELFQSMISYVDQGVMLTSSMITLIAGILYILWAEISELRD